MSYEVAVAGGLIALLAAVGIAVLVAGWWGVRARATATGRHAVLADESGRTLLPAGTADDLPFGRAGLDEESQSVLAACVFATVPADHLCWTTMVVDPALHDTPSHIRLVGHYETEFAAIDAAACLADALNECLIPGEAPLTATALGIEPAVMPSHGADGATTRRAEAASRKPGSREPLSPETLSPEPLSHIGLPIAYSGTPLAGHTVLTDLDGAPFSRR